MAPSTARPPMETYQRARRSLRARMRRLRLRAGVSKSSPGAREEALMSCSARAFMTYIRRRLGAARAHFRTAVCQKHDKPVTACPKRDNPRRSAGCRYCGRASETQFLQGLVDHLLGQRDVAVLDHHV